MKNLLRSKGAKVHTLILEQIKDVESCLKSFEEFMKIAVEPVSDIEQMRALAQTVHQQENKADDSLRQMIDSLDDSFLPATRSELIEIGTSCDKIANKCQHAAQMMVFQHFHFPHEFSPELIQIMRYTSEQFNIIVTSISKLFAQFGDLLANHQILDEIRALETKVDVIEELLYERTYAMDIPLAERMLIASHIELVCDISDIIENIADKIQIILITRKA